MPRGSDLASEKEPVEWVHQKEIIQFQISKTIIGIKKWHRKGTPCKCVYKGQKAAGKYVPHRHLSSSPGQAELRQEHHVLLISGLLFQDWRQWLG